MNNPDLSTVTAGQIRDQMKQAIETELRLIDDLTEAATWLRAGAPGRALEIIQKVLAERTRATDKLCEETLEAESAIVHDGVNCGCKSFDDCPGR